MPKISGFYPSAYKADGELSSPWWQLGMWVGGGSPEDVWAITQRSFVFGI